jgi:heat shock protein HslJ
VKPYYPIVYLGLTFAAGLLAACSAGSAVPAVEKTIFVGPAMVDCVGVAPQQCLLIKERLDDEWQLWYDSIEGFDYEEGFLYELLVEEQTVEDPPADASSLVLKLKEIISQEPVTIKTVYIGPERVECEGEGPQECYQYKEDPGDDWQLYYFGIDGFEYEEGYVYELLVAERSVENPPAGGSSTRLALIEMVDKAEPDEIAEPLSLEGTQWEMESYKNGDGETVDLLPGTRVTALFEDGEVNGSAGCNRYFGGYQLFDEGINIGPLASTQMFCAQPEGVMDQEFQFLSAMQTAAAYRIADDQLELLDAAGETAVTFKAAEPVSLEDHPWEVISYNNGKEAVVSVIIGTQLTAEFAEGTVTGSAGCNNYNAAYELDGEDGISVGPAAATRKMCAEPEGIMEQEAQFLAALQSAVEYRIDGDRVDMFDATGARALTMMAAE